MANVFATGKSIGVGFVPEGKEGVRFLATIGHSVYETDDDAFATVQQIGVQGFPPTVAIGETGRLILESGTAPDSVEIVTTLMAYAENVGSHSFLLRFYVFGPNTPEGKAEAAAMARKWVATEIEANQIKQLTRELKMATQEARRVVRPNVALPVMVAHGIGGPQSCTSTFLCENSKWRVPGTPISDDDGKENSYA